MNKKDRVVAVGLGTINSLGHSVGEFWPKLVAGETGVGPITKFDTDVYRVHYGYEVKRLSVEERTPETFLDIAVREALEQAFGSGGLDNIPPETVHPRRRGAYVGTSLSAIPTTEKAAARFHNKGPLRIPPPLMPPMIISYLSGHLARKFGLNGPTGAVDTACASGIDALVFATHKLLSGEAQIMIAAGVDVFCELLLAALNRAGVVSERPDGCRPFDRWRNGLGSGEGAAAIVLMIESFAEELGIKPLARLVGWAMSNDAHHVTSPLPGGEIAAQTMLDALSMAGIDPKLVDYLNAHGTGTRLNDRTETLAIKKAFGNIAYMLAVGSTKGATGHLSGAAGVLEALICILAILNNIIPGTTGLKQRDLRGGCDLSYVRSSIEAPVRVAATNSFGFGGHNSTLVLTEV